MTSTRNDALLKFSPDGTVIGHKPCLPLDVVGDILDNVMEGPITFAEGNISIIGDHNVSVTDIIDGFQEAKSVMLNLRLASKRYVEVANPRLFQILFVWPKHGIRVHLTAEYVNNIVGGRKIASYFTSLYFHYENVTADRAAIILEIVRSCNGLENFHLYATSYPRQALEYLMSALTEHSGATLVKFECFVQQSATFVPLVYTSSMPNLKICAATCSNHSLIRPPNLLFPLAEDSPFSTGDFSFSRLHSLNIYSPFFLAREIRKFMPSLRSLTLDFQWEYRVTRFLLDFLLQSGSNLQALDVRQIGDVRLHIYVICPFLELLVMNIMENPAIEVVENTVLHSKLRRVGLRGCRFADNETEMTSATIFKFLAEFLKKGCYPNLQEVRLLDFNPLVFQEYDWFAVVAFNWFFYMGKYSAAKIALLDMNGNMCNAADLRNMVDFMAKRRFPMVEIDGIMRRRQPRTNMKYLM